MRKTRTQYFVVATRWETLTVTAPYCAECAPRAQKHLQRLSIGMKAAMIFIPLFAVGSCVSMCLVSFLAPALIRSLPIVIALAVPTLLTALYVKANQRKRVVSAASSHICEHEMPVSIYAFSGDRLVLQVENDQYAQALRRLNA